MKLTKEQLVDLLCTATYGCDWLECRCLEDKWADRLLAGGTLVILDNEDEDENGKPKKYKLTLKDFEEKLQEAPFSDKDYIVRSWCNWRIEESDYYDCNNLLQYVMFGDVIYG